jgi:hypothetical protein
MEGRLHADDDPATVGDTIAQLVDEYLEQNSYNPVWFTSASTLAEVGDSISRPKSEASARMDAVSRATKVWEEVVQALPSDMRPALRTKAYPTTDVDDELAYGGASGEAARMTTPTPNGSNIFLPVNPVNMTSFCLRTLLTCVYRWG